MARADAPPSNAERSQGVPGDTPIRLSIVGTLESDLLERLRGSSTAVVQTADPQGGIEGDESSSGDTHACLIDHRSNTPALVPTTLSQLPQLLLVDPAQPPSDDYLLAQPHAELVSVADIGTPVFDTRLRLAIERRRLMPADPIRRHAFDILEQVMHQTTDWIVVKDLQRRFRFVSQSFADSFDLPIEQIIGRDDLQIGTPQRLVLGDATTGWKGYWEIDDDVIASGEPKARQSIVQQEDEHGQKLERSPCVST